MKRIYCLLVILLATSLPAFSAGFIILHGPDYRPHGRPFQQPAPLPPPRVAPPPRPAPQAPIELIRLEARVRIDDQIAKTILEHEFYNPNPRQLEGDFLFPVPKGSHLDRFTMEINGKTVEAELLAADKARKLYEDIVRARKDPALLEYADRDVYKVRVFPLLPQSKQRLTVSYTQVLPSDDRLVSYLLPISEDGARVSVDVQLESRNPLKVLYSPSHSVDIKRNGDHRAHISFETARGEKARGFELLFSRDESPLAVNLLTHRAANDDGYFLLLLNTSLDAAKIRTVPKDILFVLDTSGSMAGPKLEQAKKALLFCVDNLDSEDRFDLLRFSTEVEPLYGELAGASEERRSQARRFVNGLKSTGGTAIASALDRALALRTQASNRPFHIIFLTDGLPTVGVTDPEKILANVKREDNTRIFCFGIGADVNTHLLDQIAEATRAVSQYALPEEDLELKISGFYAKIKEPALTDPELLFPKGIRVSKLYPLPLPDLFKGQQLMVAGRYSGHGKGQLQLKGKTQTGAQTFDYAIEFPDRADNHDFLPRLWATRRVGFLLDEIRLRGESQELKEEATELARRYGIVTPYTAYLILEDERAREVPLTLRSFPALEQDLALARELKDSYHSFALDQKGDAAVAGARSSLALRGAQAPADAINSVNLEEARAKIAPSSLPSNLAFQSAPVLAAPDQQRYAGELRARANTFSGKTRYVAGRCFYQNEGRWVDTLSQTSDHRAPRKIQFGSEPYFALAAQHPEALPWMSLGTQVTFVLQDTLYIIHD